jgi:hypothetical protein
MLYWYRCCRLYETVAGEELGKEPVLLLLVLVLVLVPVVVIQACHQQQ